MTIIKLTRELANQIAAGEVVERPASVVKELVENSLDAGADHIEIDIESGGSKRIRVRDNGKGIAQEQLQLALERHATSKIQQLDDLDALISFGFRGEALASMSSVSRLTLSSKTKEQEQGWQAQAQGRDMDVICQPCAHPQGTTVDVVDLFFNTPARRRFLKSDKTEMNHIDEWLKRLALVRKDVSFQLKHQNKVMRRFVKADTNEKWRSRLAQICGSKFIEQAVEVSCDHLDLALTGYVQLHDASSPQMQFFYVNGRVIRDKLLMHALKQAQQRLSRDQSMSYVLQLKIEPHEMDINVHPAKHEVRFHDARKVHSFIERALDSALQQVEQTEFLSEVETPDYQPTILDRNTPSLKSSSVAHHEPVHYKKEDKRSWVAVTTPKINYQQTVQHYQKLSEPYQQSSTSNSAQFLDAQHVVYAYNSELYVLPVEQLYRQVLVHELTVKLKDGLISQPFLLPLSLKLSHSTRDKILEYETSLSLAGFKYRLQGHRVILLEASSYFKQLDVTQVFESFLQWLQKSTTFEQQVDWFADKLYQVQPTQADVWQRWLDLPKDVLSQRLKAGYQIPWLNYIKK